jgi:signal transduction histidine kinase
MKKPEKKESGMASAVPPFHQYSLRIRLMGLVILGLLPVVGVLAVTASERRNQAITDVHQNTLRLAQLAASNQQQLIAGARDILITLAQLPAIKNHDRPACLFFLTNILMQHPLYANFGAADQDGDIFCMTLPQRVPISISDQDYFINAVNNLDFAISEYQILPINSQAVITLSYPILDDIGRSNGIVFAELDLRWLYQFESAAALPAGSQLRVIDQVGTTLALYPSGEEGVGKLMPELDIAGIILRQHEGLIEGKDSTGISRLYAFTPLHAAPGSDIFMIVGIPTEAILAEPTRNLFLSLSALALGAILALISAWFGSSWLILRQVNDLLYVTRKLSAGDLSIRSHGARSGGELGELALAFNDMAYALQGREAEHLHSQAQIRKQTIRAEALARIASRLNAHLELEAVLTAICEEVSQVFHVPAVNVLLGEKENPDSIYFFSNPPLPIETQERLKFLTTNLLDTQSAIKEPAVFNLDNKFGSTIIKDAHDYQLDLNAGISAAMVHEEKMIGFLIIYARKADEIGDDELTLLKGIADEAALAITNARLYRALQNEERTRASLLSKLITAQEDERMRIARELHDETSQSLTALLVGFDTVRMAAQLHPDRIERHLYDQKSITEEMLSNIHRLIADLRPSLLDDLGLVPAITWYGDMRLGKSDIEFDFDGEIMIDRLPRAMETALFRISQEAITNVVRHSQASIVNVRLNQHGNFLQLEISDNGHGFDAQILHYPDPKRGLGLRGMQERATILGGTFDLRSSPSEGTHITVTLPLASFEV